VIVTLNLNRGRWITYDFSKPPMVNGGIAHWETAIGPNGQATKKYEGGTIVSPAPKTSRFYCDANSVNTFEITGVTI
jgi:hypothetical protein